jgi:hypothetical protein
LVKIHKSTLFAGAARQGVPATRIQIEQAMILSVGGFHQERPTQFKANLGKSG